MQNLSELLRTGLVRRYHTVPGGSEQNVAAHSWGVAMIIAALHPEPTTTLLRAALEHDCAEQAVGDVPSPAKRKNLNLRRELQQSEDDELTRLGLNSTFDLSFNEGKWLAAADMLECALWAEFQVAGLGNRTYQSVLNKAVHYLRTDIAPTEIRDWVNDHFSE